jgi:hypothetical protein
MASTCGVAGETERRDRRVWLSRRRPSEWAMALLSRGVINRSGCWPWASCWAPTRLGGLCRCAWEPSNSLLLARVRIDCEWVVLVRLHHEIASSGTRWLSCKPVVLITLGGCHLLDSLVACDSVEARKKIMRCSEGGFVRGHYARPAGATKSNSSRECH